MSTSSSRRRAKKQVKARHPYATRRGRRLVRRARRKDPAIHSVGGFLKRRGLRRSKRTGRFVKR